MPVSLLRASALLLLWLLVGLFPAAASHLIGGEMSYRYLDAQGPANRPFRYVVTTRIYYGTTLSSNSSFYLDVRTRDASGASVLNVRVPQSSSQVVGDLAVPGCSLPLATTVVALYTTTISLPAATAGYRAYVTVSARTAGITNLDDSPNQDMTLALNIAPPSLPNSSPVFSTDALIAVCLSDTSTVLNNAYDAEGDRLSYRLATPSGAAASIGVRYATGYSATQPFGATGYATVDARTGVSRYFSPNQGTYLLAIDVDEYRMVNGREVLLSTVRRDIQVVVRLCSGPPNRAPVFGPATLARKAFRLEEGQSLDLDFVATDPEGQALNMTVSSVLLDGAGPIDATVNGQAGSSTAANPLGSVSISGTGSATGAFRLRTACGMARAQPYDVAVVVSDVGCGAKSVAEVFQITVVHPAGPTVRGDSALCVGSAAAYRAVAAVPATAYRWGVRGGTVLGSATGPTVQVRWDSPGPGQVLLQTQAATGCFSDTLRYAVAVAAELDVAGPRTYCPDTGPGLRYTVAGPAGAYQWALSTGTLLSGQGTNSVLVDLPRGATATLRVATASQACPTELRIAPDNSCLLFYNVITPNGDHHNDVFEIENLGLHPNTALSVFNRWGRRVYYTNDYHNDFGGGSNGPGVYYYLCRLADGTTYKGWFEIVR